MYQRKETVDLATLPVPPGFTELKNLAKFASELSASNPPIASTSTKNVPGPSTVTTSPQNVQRPQSINMSIASDQLKLVVSRQDQLKKAALNAKQKGDLNKAKEFLTQAKSLDQMVIQTINFSSEKIVHFGHFRLLQQKVGFPWM